MSDGPNTADLLNTVLTVSHGNINVDTTTGVTIVGGNGTGSVTLSGTAAQITAALTSTSTNYTGTLNYYGPDSLSVTTTDTVNNATSATKTVGSGRRYDDGVGDGACLAERQREHRDLAERDFGVGWTEHRRPAEHGADGVARQYHVDTTTGVTIVGGNGTAR